MGLTNLILLRPLGWLNFQANTNTPFDKIPVGSSGPPYTLSKKGGDLLGSIMSTKRANTNKYHGPSQRRQSQTSQWTNNHTSIKNYLVVDWSSDKALGIMVTLYIPSAWPISIHTNRTQHLPKGVTIECWIDDQLPMIL